MNKKFAAIAAPALFFLSCLPSIATAGKASTTAQEHVDKAFALAGDSFMRTTAELQCSTDNRAMKFFKDKTIPPATKVFDNLFYVGATPVGAWALKTSEGIILIDALNNTNDARDIIEAGFQKLGLDPSTIKYIVVTHGHGDHYGGARYLSEKYKAPVLMTEEDWDLAINPPPRPKIPGLPAPNWSKAPDKDQLAVDGQELTLGDTTVRIVTTPGHTAGTISLVFPVVNNGERHVAGLWGGTGLPRNPAGLQTYSDSAKKFKEILADNDADVALSNHGFVDDSLKRMATLSENPKSNPFVIGEEAVARYVDIFSECALAAKARSQKPK